MSAEKKFTTRPFKFSEAVHNYLVSAKKINFKALHMKHGSNLGEDYQNVYQWNGFLSKRYNWSGSEMRFYMLCKAYAREHKAIDPYVRQVIFEHQGKPVGYLRFCHMKYGSVVRPADVTKVEATLVSGTNWMLNPSLFVAMYDYACKQAIAFGQKRVLTELLVGLKSQEMEKHARVFATKSRKLRIDQKDRLAINIAQTALAKDWYDATLRFISQIGFSITDSGIPKPNYNDIRQPQLRISKILGSDPTPLPKLKNAIREFKTFEEDPELEHVHQWIKHERSKALKKYGLNEAALT